MIGQTRETQSRVVAMSSCYKCDAITGCLSPRSRCVKCEYESNLFNENENEILRAENAELEQKLSRAQSTIFNQDEELNQLTEHNPERKKQ